MNKFLLIGFLIICLAALSGADCPDKFYNCYDSRDNKLGVYCEGTCWDWGGFKCKQCHSDQFYMGECRKHYPNAVQFGISGSNC